MYVLSEIKKKLFRNDYPEIDSVKFKCVVWTFKQQIALKCEGIVESIALLLTSLYYTFRNAG